MLKYSISENPKMAAGNLGKDKSISYKRLEIFEPFWLGDKQYCCSTMPDVHYLLHGVKFNMASAAIDVEI